jgi:hypothetical protein
LVESIWPHVTKLIERALIKSESDYTIEQVKARIEDGTALLWIIWSQPSTHSGDLLAAGTTELVKLTDGRLVCVVASCAGRNLKKWDCLLADIEAYAKREGCVAVRCYGRPGWARYLKGMGYAQPWIVVEKTVK